MLWKHLPHAAGEYHKRWELEGRLLLLPMIGATESHVGTMQSGGGGGVRHIRVLRRSLLFRDILISL